MSLSKVTTTKPATPYEKLPPIHIHVLSMTEQKRTLQWQFTEAGEPKPSLTKTNKIVAITDGTTVVKITLFENLASKLTECRGYIMKNYSVKGDVPPYQIYITKNTVFYNTVAIDVADDLRVEAQRLLSPPSKLTPLCRVRDVDGLLSTEGMVVEVSPIKQVRSGRDVVPLRTVILKEDTAQMTISLWRDAALLPVKKGMPVRLSHLKGNVTNYGYQLQSTAFTTVEEVISSDTVSALGVLQHPDKPGVLKLLVQREEYEHTEYEIDEEIWQPLSQKMVKLPFFIKIKYSALKVTEAQVADKTEE